MYDAVVGVTLVDVARVQGQVHCRIDMEMATLKQVAAHAAEGAKQDLKTVAVLTSQNVLVLILFESQIETYTVDALCCQMKQLVVEGTLYSSCQLGLEHHHLVDDSMDLDADCRNWAYSVDWSQFQSHLCQRQVVFVVVEAVT